MNNIYLNYGDIIKSLQDFRKVDHDGFNRFDSPASLYFRIVFYFNEDQGLLGLNGMTFDDEINEIEKNIANLKAAYTKKDGSPDELSSVKNFNDIKNTAYHYLLLNDELDRAYMLKKFVMLLSDINSKSPWYFSSISGLDGALERKMFDKEFKIEEERKAITIKCLPDAYDNRIGTLLELYRQICYSYTMKKEIIPANLRKFNMGVLIFNQPIRGLGGKSGKDAKIFIPDSREYMYVPSCKLIELTKCEIDQNSIKTAFGELKTEEPLSPEYTITIYYDDAYEYQYNEVMQYVITDFINTDIQNTDYKYYEQKDKKGNTPEGRRTLKLNNGGESFKGYWVNREPESDIYSNTMEENSLDNSVRDMNDIGGKKPFTSMLSNVKNKVEKAIQIPDIIPDRNIHDAGNVQHYGAYEYLNRIKGTDGLLGQAAATATSLAVKKAKEKVTQLLTGNIYGANVSKYLTYVSKAVAGDYSGLSQDIKNERDKNKKSNENNENLDGKKLPQYNQEKLERIRKLTEKKSIYNNI